MSLTCHFIDDDWKLHKRILNVCKVEDHKGETVGRKIELCLHELGIDGIFTLTMDNESCAIWGCNLQKTLSKSSNRNIIAKTNAYNWNQQCTF